MALIGKPGQQQLLFLDKPASSHHIQGEETRPRIRGSL